MPTFTDAVGRDWELTLTVTGLEKIRELDPKFLLDSPLDTFNRIEADYVLACQAAWILCQEQAEKKQVQMRAFYDQLRGDALGGMMEALLTTITDFIPRHLRELLLAGVAKNKAMRELLTLKAMQKINDPALAERMVKAAENIMDAELGKLTTRFESAGNSRVSSGSTQGT